MVLFGDVDDNWPQCNSVYDLLENNSNPVLLKHDQQHQMQKFSMGDNFALGISG